MDRWSGKVAVVTGASSGIGASIVEHLVKAGMIVIGLARRLDRLNELKAKLPKGKGQFHCIRCDVANLISIKSAFAEIKEKFKGINVLVNNAGIIQSGKILSDKDNEKYLDLVIRTNLMGSVYCTKEMYKIMKDTGEPCHIININSIAGHSILHTAIETNLYPSSKFALRVETEIIRKELENEKNFRVSSISPGLVRTEIFNFSDPVIKDHVMQIEEILEPEDIAKSVMFALEMPKHVLIAEMIVRPVGEKL